MCPLQLNLNQVISFYYLAKERSFSGAAEKLGISQPAVTQHVRGIEIQFGLKLAFLKKKRVYLTKAGERFMVYAEDIYSQAMATQGFLKSYKFNNITIGISSPLLFYFTPLIDDLKENFSRIKVSIREGSSQQLIEELLNYRIDLCLIGKTSISTKNIQHFRIQTDDPLVFVSSPDYPIPSDLPVSWNELHKHPLIIQTEGSAARALILNYFKMKGLTPLIGAEVNNIELAKKLALQKKGVAVMFEPNIRDEIAANILKIIRIQEDRIAMGAIDVLVNNTERISPSVESFLMMIKKNYKGKFYEVCKAAE